MNTICSANPCPIILSSSCVFYEGPNLVCTGIITNETLSSVIQKLSTAICAISVGSGILQVTATSPITSSGGRSPNISTSMSTNKLIGRATTGVGIMEEISLGTGLSFTGSTLNVYPIPFEYNINGSGIQPALGGNIASGGYSSIGGGYQNTACGIDSSVLGGTFNTASGPSSTVGGGKCNNASASASIIAGGCCNIANSGCSTIGGGISNSALNDYASVVGGHDNSASGNYSFVGGGYNNISSNNSSIIGGGRFNQASGAYTTIGGGSGNLASLCGSTVAGGYYNYATGLMSAILGGEYNNINGYSCSMIVGSNLTADRACTTFVNNLSIKNIPTSSAGLPSGSIWRSGSAVCIVP
jgi:hypothetical protein